MVPEHRRLQVYILSFSFYILFLVVCYSGWSLFFRLAVLLIFGLVNVWEEIKKYTKYDEMPKDAT
jgi:hypothetical protein